MSTSSQLKTVRPADDELDNPGLKASGQANDDADTARPEDGKVSLDEILVTEEEETRELCKQRLSEIITALNNREFLTTAHFIPPSIFLLPFPEIYDEPVGPNGKQGTVKKVRIKVYSFDLQDDISSLDEIVTQLLSLAYFRDIEGDTLNRNETFNLIKALTEYFHEFTLESRRTEAVMVADYEVTAKTLDRLPIVPALRPNGSPYSYVKNQGKRRSPLEINVDLEQAHKFKKYLVEKFLRKDQEIKGKLNSVRKETQEKATVPLQMDERSALKKGQEKVAAANRVLRPAGVSPRLTQISDAFQEAELGKGDSDVRKMSAEKRLIYEKTEKLISDIKEIARLFTNGGNEFGRNELVIIGNYLIDPQNKTSPMLLSAMLIDLQNRVDRQIIIRKMNTLRDEIAKLKPNPVTVRLLVTQFFADPQMQVDDYVKEQLVEEFEKHAEEKK